MALGRFEKGTSPWNKGVIGISDDTREKMRVAKLGKPGNRLGVKNSIETRKKLSETHKKIGTIPPSRLGTHITEEHKNILRKSYKGQATCFKKGAPPWCKGTKGLVVAWNKGLKTSLPPWNKGKKNPNLSGENHWAWKGGVTPINHKIRMSLEYKLWRRSVFDRDGYTCVWCGDKSAEGKKVVLQADHIKPFAYFPELRFAIDNGRTLCILCHKKTNTYGIKSVKLFGRKP